MDALFILLLALILTAVYFLLVFGFTKIAEIIIEWAERKKEDDKY